VNPLARESAGVPIGAGPRLFSRIQADELTEGLLGLRALLASLVDRAQRVEHEGLGWPQRRRAPGKRQGFVQLLPLSFVERVGRRRRVAPTREAAAIGGLGEPAAAGTKRAARQGPGNGQGESVAGLEVGDLSTIAESFSRTMRTVSSVNGRPIPSPYRRTKQ